jgi:ATP-dependent protease HslVU (ClpYQ) ATPase subunit
MSCKAAHHFHHAPEPLNASKERSDFKENAEEHKNHRNSFRKKLRNGTCTQEKVGQNFLAGIILSILNLTMVNNFEKDRTYTG